MYNSYMFDLIPFENMPVILQEFWRVLKPGERLVLVNMSKRDDHRLTRFEQLYTHLPARWVPYVLGGCRPVLMEELLGDADFCEIQREFMPHIMPSEIVLARKK